VTHPTLSAVSAKQSTKRRAPEVRKQEVLSEAILYFADEGFDGGTRGLAKRIGITQPLFYRYFPSKDDLVNEVYRAVYLDRWQDSWEVNLRDDRQPLEARLLQFYSSYTSVVFERNWLRIYFFAGLKGLDINARYLQRVESALLIPIWAQTRAAFGKSPSDVSPTAHKANDLVWQMHGAVFYHGIRQQIYGDTSVDINATIQLAVKTFLVAAKAALLSDDHT
jgi:AcrR family transcriptional regulator